jgi:hypothetical protein
MLCLRWHRISDGRATGPGRTQDLSATMPEVFWQGSDKRGVDGFGAGAFRGRRGWTGLQSAGNL